MKAKLPRLLPARDPVRFDGTIQSVDNSPQESWWTSYENDDALITF